MKKLLSVILCITLLAGICAVASAEDDHAYYVEYPGRFAEHIKKVRDAAQDVIDDLKEIVYPEKEQIYVIDLEIDQKKTYIIECLQKLTDYNETFDEILAELYEFLSNDSGYNDTTIAGSYVEKLKSYATWFFDNFQRLRSACYLYFHVVDINDKLSNLQYKTLVFLPLALQLIRYR